MRSIWVAVVLVLALGAAVSEARARGRLPRFGVDSHRVRAPVHYAYREKWYTQTLDHFNFGSQPATYQQRYVVVDQYWDGKGPMFFYTGNEGDIVWFMQNTGFMFDIAPQFHALLIFAEHRYYGQSLPFGNHSFDLDKVGFLTTEQVLADYAQLITYLKEQVYKVPDQPVVAFGGSYGGMLAGWFRLKYPNIVAGAIAASAPIICGNDTVQYAFNEIVTDDYAAAGCSQGMQKAFTQISSLLTTTSGLQQLSQQFSLCQPLTSSDVSQFMGFLENALQNLAMVDYPYPTDFLKQLPAWPVQVTCDRFQQMGGDVVSGLSNAIRLWYNDTGLATCFNITDQSEGQVGDQAWDYQSCTELVLPCASNGKTDMFPAAPFSRDYFTAYCQKTWGVTPRYDWVREYYGNYDIGAGSNIVFSNGQLDPWRGLGVVQSPTAAIQTVVIAQGAHHLDLRAANPADPQSVVDARNLEVQQIKAWLSEAAKHHHHPNRA